MLQTFYIRFQTRKVKIIKKGTECASRNEVKLELFRCV